MTDRRQPNRAANPHHLAVHLVKDRDAGIPLAGRLEVRCACGLVVGGKRFADRIVVTLSDLLELVRLHNSGSQP